LIDQTELHVLERKQIDVSDISIQHNGMLYLQVRCLHGNNHTLKTKNSLHIYRKTSFLYKRFPANKRKDHQETPWTCFWHSKLAVG